MIYWFSGNGNSAWVAQQLALLLGEQVACIQADAHSEICVDGQRFGLVFPVHAWSMPKVVADFLKRLLIKDNTRPYVFFVGTFGDDVGKTSRDVRRALLKQGLTLQGTFGVQMPNTYVCLPFFDVDSPTLAQQKLERAKETISQIAKQVQQAACTSYGLVPGAFPWTKTYLLGLLFRTCLLNPKYFHAEPQCIACGKCAKVCPMKNITMQEGVPRWGTNCSMCLACYHHCPRHAVAWKRFTRGKGQYFFKEK